MSKGVNYSLSYCEGKVEFGPGSRDVSCCPRSFPSRKKGLFEVRLQRVCLEGLDVGHLETPCSLC